MSEVKFVNEAWQWEHDNETACTISVFNFNGDEICRLQSEVNANLIAAAPEMYRTLEKLIQPYGMEDFSHDEVLQLLAKARGE